MLFFDLFDIHFCYSHRLKAPCPDCAAPYGFINHMPLDTDAARFARLVNQTRISGNLDAPEGGFDAIMQAIVCERQIGWRNHSRRLLLFSTDSGFHYAGDGKVGDQLTFQKEKSTYFFSYAKSNKKETK